MPHLILRKSISTAFPIILLLLVLASGFLLVRILEKVGTKHLREQSENVMEAMAAGIQNELLLSRNAVSGMAGSPWILLALLDPNPANIENANSVLERYNANFGFSVCYLLNLQGNTIAASNRTSTESFVGENYAFRPYFQEALKGIPSIYMATGITTRERGFYSAHVVKDKSGKAVGVVAIKKNVEAAESVLAGYGDSFFVSPGGVIFISGIPDMVLKVLSPLTNEQRRTLKDSNQFNVMSFEPVFPGPIQEGKDVWYRGGLFKFFQRDLGPPGWSLVLLAPMRSVHDFILLGWIISAFMTGSILFLMRWSSLRSRDQNLLAESEERYRGLFLNSRDAIMVLKPPSWKFISGNPATIKMFGVENEEAFKSLGPWDLSPERQPDGLGSAEKAKAMIEAAVSKGFLFFEWTHKRLGGEEFPATVLLTRMMLGKEMILQATVRDITWQKKTEEELRLKVAELERFNKIAVGRELRMIELKTALKALEKGKE